MTYTQWIHTDYPLRTKHDSLKDQRADKNYPGIAEVHASITWALQSFPRWRHVRDHQSSADLVHTWNAPQWIAQVRVVLLLLLLPPDWSGARRDSQGPATPPFYPETTQLQGLLGWWPQTQEEDRQAGDRESKQETRAGWDLGISLSSLSPSAAIPQLRSLFKAQSVGCRHGFLFEN